MSESDPILPASSLTERVAEEVRAWAARRQMSQQQIGAILGVSQGQVSARMRGRMPFSLTDLETLAAAFGIEPREFLPTLSSSTTRSGIHAVNYVTKRYRISTQRHRSASPFPRGRAPKLHHTCVIWSSNRVDSAAKVNISAIRPIPYPRIAS